MESCQNYTNIDQSIKLTVEIERKIVEIASKNPREGYDNLPFSTWSLRVLAEYVSKKLNQVDSISHTEIRNILLKHGKVSSRQSKITLGSNTDLEYDLKKRELKN